MSTDPRRLGGGISGPVNPFGHRDQVVDTRNAVLMGEVHVTVIEPYRDGEAQPLNFGLLLSGRINRTQDHVTVLYMLDEDGLAALLTELHGVTERAGWEVSGEVTRRLRARWRDMPHPRT